MAYKTQNLKQHSSLQYPNLHFRTFGHCLSLSMPWSPPKWCLSFRLSKWAVCISSSFWIYVLHAPTLLTYQELIIQLSGEKYGLWKSSLHSSLVPHKTTSLYWQQVTFLTISNIKDKLRSPTPSEEKVMAVHVTRGVLPSSPRHFKPTYYNAFQIQYLHTQLMYHHTSAIYQTVACQQLVWPPVSGHLWDRLALAERLAEGCRAEVGCLYIFGMKKKPSSIPVM